jgi:hypothetical protein
LVAPRSDNAGRSRLLRLNPIVCIVIVFILSRLLYFSVGVRFDVSTLGSAWQFIDPDLLRNNLFQSLYYLHSQPPLFNLFLGGILKLFPNNEALAFNLIYLFLGCTLSVSIFVIMTKLGVSNRLSAILTILFMVSPSCVLYENWLFYTYPTATFLCLAGLFLHKFASNKKWRYGIVFFALLSLIVLTRSSFHILWFILFVAMLLFHRRYDWRKVVFAACVPFLLCFLWYSKNAYVFRTFSSSSWFGMNFIRTLMLPARDKMSLVDQGKISKISILPPFKPLSLYRTYADWPQAQETNIPVLDQEVKSTGEINLNNIGYIDISKQYLRDAIYILTSRPRAYLLGLLRSYFIFFLPSADYDFLDANREHVQPIDRFYDIVFYGRLVYDSKPPIEKENILNMGLFLIIGYSVSVFYGLRLTLDTLSGKHKNLPFALTALFLWINIIYVTLIGNAFEILENNRFRFVIDPLFLIILGVFLERRFKKSRKHLSYSRSKNLLETVE